MVKEKPSSSQKPWTAEEIEFLSEYWGIQSIPSLAKNLKRSTLAVKLKASRLNLGAFLESGDYITLHQLVCAVTGSRSGVGYILTSWVENRGLPVHTKKVEDCSFRVVYLSEFWEWAEKNRAFIDFNKMEPLILGEEPTWVEEQRRMDFKSFCIQNKTPWTEVEIQRLIFLVKQFRYSYVEISKELGRSNGAIQRKLTDLGVKERPLKADNHIKWTDSEISILNESVLKGDSYHFISEKVGKSEKAIRGKLYMMYGTEVADKIRAMLLNKEVV